MDKTDNTHKTGTDKTQKTEIGRFEDKPTIDYENKTFTVYCERQFDGHVKNLYGEDIPSIATADFLISDDGLGGAKIILTYDETKYTNAEALVNAVFGTTEGRSNLAPEVYDYAVNRCFVENPNPAFLAYHGNNTPEHREPISGRKSSYFGSRFVSIAFYQALLNFYNGRNGNTGWNWTEKVVGDLLKSLDKAMKDLRENLFGAGKPFEKNAGETAIMHSTLSAVLFAPAVEVGGKTEHPALLLWSGDARVYKVDPTDGVLQLTVDDSLENDRSTMAELFKLGSIMKYPSEFIKVRRVTLREPCAVFTCSDGIYDTRPYTKIGSSSDLAFERDMQSLFRRSTCLDTLRLGIGYEFYYDASDWWKSKNELAVQKDELFTHGIKPDDSGTLAVKFFGDSFLPKDYVGENTTLDRLLKLVEKGKISEGYVRRFGRRETDGDTNVSDELIKDISSLTTFDNWIRKRLLESSNAFDKVIFDKSATYPMNTIFADQYLWLIRKHVSGKAEEILNSIFSNRLICGKKPIEYYAERVINEIKQLIDAGVIDRDGNIVKVITTCDSTYRLLHNDEALGRFLSIFDSKSTDIKKNLLIPIAQEYKKVKLTIEDYKAYAYEKCLFWEYIYDEEIVTENRYANRNECILSELEKNKNVSDFVFWEKLCKPFLAAEPWFEDEIKFTHRAFVVRGESVGKYICYDYENTDQPTATNVTREQLLARNLAVEIKQTKE